MAHVNPASFLYLLPLFLFIPMVSIGTILKKRGYRGNKKSHPKAMTFGRRNRTGKPSLLRKTIQLIAPISACLLLIVIAAAVASPLLSRFQPEPPWDPELPPPIKDPEDVFPKGPGSLLQYFSLTYYNLEKTTAENEDELRIALVNELDEHKQNRTLFDLPDGFVVRGNSPSDAFKTAKTLSEYDQQILDAYIKLTTSGLEYSDYQYHRINVTALNCLDNLSRQCEKGIRSYDDAWEDFLYYGELAVWAQVNEYVCSDSVFLKEGGQVDLFYRIAQAYDHVGTATTDENPPFKHELYLIADAFLDLSLRSLKTIDFSLKNNEYRSSVWNLYMTMNFRMGKYVEQSEGFFKNIENCKEAIIQLELTDQEKSDVQSHMDDLQEWRELH